MSTNFLVKYLHHIEEIERAIRALQIDTLVCGIGPTAWLLPWMDQALIRPLRVWGTHDFCRVYPANDLVLMDDTRNHLRQGGDRYQAIVDSRPDRIWIYAPYLEFWKHHLAQGVHSICQPVDFTVHWPHELPEPQHLGQVQFTLNSDKPHTAFISPLGATTLAWQQGCRRIGVLGVDMQPEQHHTGQGLTPTAVDAFFSRIAIEARNAGGCIVNLSPVSSLTNWRGMKP